MTRFLWRAVPAACCLLLLGAIVPVVLSGELSHPRSLRSQLDELGDLRAVPASSTGSCGVFRWSVKTGTDADAGKVNLNATTPTTIATQTAITAPGSLPSNNRISPVETTIFSVDATMVEFGLAADSDYHVAISDGNGHSMITEIPDPACVGAGSPFAAGITNARNEFNARFNPSTTFQQTSVPVHIRGVGFWDTVHGQSFVAPNGIEIHPVLDITFGTPPSPSPTPTPNPSPSATPTPNPTPTPTPNPGGELITDGGFEAATATGNSAPGWSATTNVSRPGIVQFHGPFPNSGTNYAELGGNNNETDTLTQTVAIPSSAASPSLTFMVNVVSQEAPTTGAFDFLKVEVHSSSGSLLATPLSLDNRNQTNDNNTNGSYFRPAPVDLSAYKGQTIQLTFRATNGVKLPTTFRVDDVSVTTTGSGGGGGSQLLGNPGFENGTNASPWIATDGVIGNGAQEPPHSGHWDAWLDGYGTTHTDTLTQQVSIPAGLSRATLSFWLHIDTAETTTTTVYDTLQVQILDTSGSVLQTLATYSNLDAASGYTQRTFDLSAYIGQTVKLNLVGQEDFEFQTSFVVDDFALNVQ